MSETREHQLIFLESWEELDWSDDEAKIKAEEANLNYIDLVLLKSKLLGVGEDEHISARK